MVYLGPKEEMEMKESPAVIAVALAGWILVFMLIVGCIWTRTWPSTMTKIPATYKKVE